MHLIRLRIKTHLSVQIYQKKMYDRYMYIDQLNNIATSDFFLKIVFSKYKRAPDAHKRKKPSELT